MRTSPLVRFRPRTLIVLSFTSAISACGFMWPFLINAESVPLASIFFWAASAFAIVLFIIEISNESLDAKSIALLGVLTAIVAALRPLGAGAVGIEPMWFLLILSARVFGSSFGFILGLTSILTSALLTGGIGPWLGYQLFAAGWIGLFAGWLPKKIRGRPEILILVLYAIAASFIFGLLMDLQFWPWALGLNTQLSYIPNGDLLTNLHRFVIFHFATSMAWDMPRAIFTSALIILSAPAILGALRRTKFRAAFVTPIEFVESKKAAIERAKELKAL
jgi:energy-coupling factor transport system substrate-specific component